MRATTNHKHITPTTKTHLGQRDPANNPHNSGQPATPEHPKQSYGGHSDRETPGPIPNPEAKPASADDTTQPGWKSRTPPNTHRNTPHANGGCFCVQTLTIINSISINSIRITNAPNIG